VQSVPPPTPALVPAAAPTTGTSYDLFLLIALVVLGVTAILGFFLWQQRAQDRRLSANVGSPKRRRDKRRGGTAAATARTGRFAMFCTQCGHALGSDDNFCPQCGTRRRVQG
jgi:uncharacterized iron-regulated membrane protein